MIAIDERVLAGRSAPPVCLFENPHRLVSLLDMLNFFAAPFMRAIVSMGAGANGGIPVDAKVLESAQNLLAENFTALRRAIHDMGLPVSGHLAAEIANLLELGVSYSVLSDQIINLRNTILIELDSVTFLQLSMQEGAHYTNPLNGWGSVVDRFGCGFDAEEASKCLALKRYTGAVFHLMRIAEYAVLELQMFLDKSDPKAHFGSVLAKLDQLNRKTEFSEIPDHLRPFRNFLIEILPQMHAVKDSWRNKVSHVDGRIIPVDTFTEEMAIGVHSATLLLMHKLAAGLPSKGS